MSHCTACAPDQWPCVAAPMSIAMRWPCPLLKRVPRTLARSQFGPEIAGAHLGIRFEPAAGEHHGLGAQLDVLVALARAHALHAAARVHAEPRPSCRRAP